MSEHIETREPGNMNNTVEEAFAVLFSRNAEIPGFGRPMEGCIDFDMGTVEEWIPVLFEALELELARTPVWDEDFDRMSQLRDTLTEVF